MPFVLAPAGRDPEAGDDGAPGSRWSSSVWPGSTWASTTPRTSPTPPCSAGCCREALYRWFVPDESFPVSYARGGNAAHLDLGGAAWRGGQDGDGRPARVRRRRGRSRSGSRAPGARRRCCMTMADGTRVFGKIYATSHVRADRWYRVGPHDHVRQARGRDPVRVGAPARRVRGLRAARARDERRRRSRRPGASWSSRPTGSTCS